MGCEAYQVDKINRNKNSLQQRESNTTKLFSKPQRSTYLVLRFESQIHIRPPPCAPHKHHCSTLYRFSLPQGVSLKKTMTIPVNPVQELSLNGSQMRTYILFPKQQRPLRATRWDPHFEKSLCPG